MKTIFALLSLTFILSACATTESFVKKPISSEQAIVSIGKTKFQPGDKVGLYQQTCQEKRRGGRMSDVSYSVCQKAKVGFGEVIRLVSEKEAVVEVGKEVALKEGLLVEKE